MTYILSKSQKRFFIIFLIFNSINLDFGKEVELIFIFLKRKSRDTTFVSLVWVDQLWIVKNKMYWVNVKVIIHYSQLNTPSSCGK